MLSRSSVVASALLGALLSSPVAAQLSTACNPMLKDCPADPALATAHNFVFNATPSSDLFAASAGAVKYDSVNGAAFTIDKKGVSPTLTSAFYFFFGRTEIIMRAAAGTGIVSSIVWGSDNLDEMDWEFLGGDPGNVQTNYFGKGETDFTSGPGNGAKFPVAGGVQADWHNYTNIWTKDKLEWWIDGKLVRTLLPKDANNTRNYPQTPMSLRLGIWPGGDDSQPKGTIDWAGGATDYSKGPYTMYVKSAYVEDFSKAKEYLYGDRSGSMNSIKLVQPDKNSTAVESINRPPSTPDESIGDKWNKLPSGTKTGVYIGAVGVVSVMLVALLFYYFRQRRRGQREAALAAKNQEQERLELERFQKEGRNPDALAFDGADYDANSMRKDGMISSSAYSVPDSRSNSLHGTHRDIEKGGWDPTAAGGLTPAMPLLRDGAQSPRVVSPGGPGFNGPSRNGSFGPVSPVSPMRMGSPGPQSASYGGGMDRIGSPGPQPGAYGGGMDRMGSPAPMQPPARSFSSPRSPGGYGGDHGYFNNNHGGGGGYR